MDILGRGTHVVVHLCRLVQVGPEHVAPDGGQVHIPLEPLLGVQDRENVAARDSDGVDEGLQVVVDADGDEVLLYQGSRFQERQDGLVGIVGKQFARLGNVETICSLYPKVRPQADYKRSLDVLCYMKRKGFITKSGIMLGVGETVDEVHALMRDLRDVGCDIMTIGQYFRPSLQHIPVEKDYTQAEFDALRDYGLEIGFKEVYSGRFVRSSFNAKEIHQSMIENVTTARH